MNSFWHYFDNTDEPAYAVDIEKHEIVYMNRKALDTYGVYSVMELKDKKCYEVIYGNSSPCASCKNDLLSEGKFFKWHYFDRLNNEDYLIMDTLTNIDGRKFRFEIKINTGEKDAVSHESDRYRSLEAIVNDGIKKAVTEADPERSIAIILEFLGKTLNGERAYIFEKNQTGGDDNTYEWVAAGVTPEKDNLQNLPPEVCANWYSYFRRNKNIIFDDIEKMKEDDPLQYENLKRQNIRSIVVVPLYGDDKVIGFYGIDNPPEQDLMYTLDMLQIVGYFISSLLKKRDYINQIRDMSLHDQLTKLGNRYAMDEYICNIEKNRQLGIVYCDITGLKRTNDTMGHKKGDELICRAGNCLREALGEYGLFRVGGDELLAICVDIDENTLKQRVDLLHKIVAKNSVVLAIGSAWDGSCSDDLQKTIDEAERLMYAEKSRYYQSAGIDRRR